MISKFYKGSHAGVVLAALVGPAAVPLLAQASSLTSDPGSAPEAAPIVADPRLRKEARKQDNTVLLANSECRNNGGSSPYLAVALRACDARLKLPDYGDILWPARTNLLHNRATILFRMNERARALEALDQADAIAAQSSDPFWKWSGGANASLLRAADAFGGGDTVTAKALVDSVAQLRPFSPSFNRSTEYVYAMMERDPAKLAARLNARARIDPSAYRILIYLDMLLGRTEAARLAASQYSTIRPMLRKGWKFDSPAGEIEEARDTLNVLCVSAYVANLAGNTPEKDAYMESAEAVIERYHEPNPATPVHDKERKFRIQTGMVLESALAAWTRAMQLRRDLGDKSLDEIKADFAASTNPRDVLPAFIEMMSTRSRAGKADAEIAKHIVDNFLSNAFFVDTSSGINGLTKILPDVENTFSVSKFDNNTNDWLVGTFAGYSQKREEDTAVDIRTVHYETAEGTTLLAEELLALAIANYARKDGYDGFVILSRRTIGRQTNIAFNGPVQFVGWDAQARVMMIRGGIIPQGRNIVPERVIRVSEVEQALGPRFSSYAAFRAARDAAEKAAKKAKN